MEAPQNYRPRAWLIFSELLKTLGIVTLILLGLALVLVLLLLPWIAAAGTNGQSANFDIAEGVWQKKLVVQTYISQVSYERKEAKLIFQISDGSLSIAEAGRHDQVLPFPGAAPDAESFVSDAIAMKKGFLIAVTGLEHTLYVNDDLSSMEEVPGLTLDWRSRGEFDKGPGPARIVQFSDNGGTINTVVDGALYSFDDKELQWIFERRFHEPDDKWYGRAWTSVYFNDESGGLLLTVFPSDGISLRVSRGCELSDITNNSSAVNFERSGRIVRLRLVEMQGGGHQIGLQNERGEVYFLPMGPGELRRGRHQARQIFSFSPIRTGFGFYYLNNEGKLRTKQEFLYRL